VKEELKRMLIDEAVAFFNTAQTFYREAEKTMKTLSQESRYSR
jgi:hypothetical protein